MIHMSGDYVRIACIGKLGPTHLLTRYHSLGLEGPTYVNIISITFGSVVMFI